MNRRGAARDGRPPAPARRPTGRRRVEISENLEASSEAPPGQIAELPYEQSRRDPAERREDQATPGSDRRRLQAEMIEMRERYRDGAVEAAANLERFEELSSRAKALLDEEFPGWEADPDERRSDMVTLYFQYRADADRAAGIQEKFSRLTRDIELLLSEEFPDWQP
jgi:hypothetical protein